MLASATAVRTGAATPAGDPAGLRTVAVVPAGDGDLIAVRYQPAGSGPTEPVDELPEWSLDLARLRLGLSQALLDATVTHLRERRAGDVPLLLQQLVKGALADAVTEQLEMCCVLAAPASGEPAGAALVDLHRQITLTDRMLLRLLGASGFTLDGPGRTVHASELLADVWAGGPPPEGHHV
ncbi:hypothetical protein [Phytohabitans rumicis]|uniref:Acyl-CoA dehydrogenase/oxidase C-terminal domain-containing protein n=1 Tax=Phytohabitans rumicis TaxID=1076125 RepID=A0A6V8KY58_9ACTN|nr:hypothetical protein [Phytohabitans rumicis]GFJ86746.1 hypothetical protein Prum_003880 [Phytohabitans rumicis]